WTKARNHWGASLRDSEGATIAEASAFSPRPTRTWRRNCRLLTSAMTASSGFGASRRPASEVSMNSCVSRETQRGKHETKTMPQRDISPHETAPEQGNVDFAYVPVNVGPKAGAFARAQP